MKRSTIPGFCAAFGALICFPHLSFGQDPPPDPKDYDRDGDGILSAKEHRVFALHCASPDLRKMDTNKSGRVEQAERDAFVLKINREAESSEASIALMASDSALVHGLNAKGPLNYAEVRDLYDARPGREKYAPNWFRMRGRVSDFSVPPKDKAVANISPAIFSYGRNFIQDGDTWAARGAIGGYWTSPSLDSALAIGADFDKVATDLSSEKKVDTLVLRAMGEYIPKRGGSIPGLDALQIRYGADYGTNFDFQGGTLGLAAEIEPLWALRAFKGRYTLFGEGHGRTSRNFPALGLRNHFRIEGGSTLDEFETASTSVDDYLRAGGTLDARLWPFGTEFPVALTASYSYLAEMLSEGDDFHNFKTGLEWQLDASGHFSLRLEYVEGLTPLVMQEQENLLLSLSVRF